MRFNITPVQAKQFRKSGLLPPKMKKKERIKQLEARVKELEQQNCSLTHELMILVNGTRDEQKTLIHTKYRLQRDVEQSTWAGLIKKMDEPLMKTSDQWAKELGVGVIVDPDGWDRENFDYSWHVERITAEEFQRRLSLSTVKHKTN